MSPSSPVERFHHTFTLANPHVLFDVEFGRMSAGKAISFECGLYGELIND
jgi:hypothetical protein